MVAITGTSRPDTQRRHTHQQVEDMPAFEPVTKFNARVDSVERLPDMFLQAFRAATTATPVRCIWRSRVIWGKLEDQSAE